MIALGRAGLSDAVLLAKVNSLPCGYDVSTTAILRLKDAGVSNRVIAAMVDRCAGSVRAQGAADAGGDPLVKRPPGLYVSQMEGPGAVLRVIRPTLVGGVRVTGNGSVVFPYMARLEVPQEAAQTVVDKARPSFYFYFDPADGRVNDFGGAVTFAAQSPAEFSLVRFKAVQGRREMTIGRVSTFNTDIGVDRKNTLPFATTELGDGIFRADIPVSLGDGQYGFVLKSNKGYRVYDFAVRGQAAPSP